VGRHISPNPMREFIYSWSEIHRVAAVGCWITPWRRETLQSKPDRWQKEGVGEKVLRHIPAAGCRFEESSTRTLRLNMLCNPHPL
jgi:hypothetical protein